MWGGFRFVTCNCLRSACACELILISVDRVVPAINSETGLSIGANIVRKRLLGSCLCAVAAAGLLSREGSSASSPARAVCSTSRTTRPFFLVQDRKITSLARVLTSVGTRSPADSVFGLRRRPYRRPTFAKGAFPAHFPALGAANCCPRTCCRERCVSSGAIAAS